ncbi:peptide chain release factor 1 [Candidatus Shikimatogenerans silvanidophilus]|uniref:peptide chain release factor 1 n=1 Tax=Candidatus Shikimatogenerans silvanidophilus TaxID=2782547 RepID=UPI002A4E1824|nr:PCRF domain-containing protein [Candidatus Shikimatogenerans silvanidophilus]
MYIIYIKKKNKYLYETNIFISEEKDNNLLDMANIEKKNLLKDIKNIKNNFKKFFFLINKKDNKNYIPENTILEIRSGIGGDEACIFAEDMFKMYTMYFKYSGWKFEILNNQIGNIGYKEIIIRIFGKQAYENLQFESGVHRVQRIPKTESQGRLHTSAVTIAVLPELEKLKIKINFSDIKRETFRSSGAGGQHVNKIESAVRLTHIPTKISVECQEERSQHKNYEKALNLLRYKLYKIKLKNIETKRSNLRKLLISTGDRSVKIRTYNYPQRRITDHRINKSLYNLDDFMKGNIQKMIDLLKKNLKNKNKN